jgi:hypothetical protein
MRDVARSTGLKENDQRIVTWLLNSVRLHSCTDARKTPQKLPFPPFFGTSGAACKPEGWLGNTLKHHEIGHEPCSAGPSQNRVGIGAPKLPHRFPLIVHYLRLFTFAPDPYELA